MCHYKMTIHRWNGETVTAVFDRDLVHTAPSKIMMLAVEIAAEAVALDERENRPCPNLPP